MINDLVICKASLSDTHRIQQCVDAAYHHYIDRIGKPPGPMLDDYHKLIQQHSVFTAKLDETIGVLVLVKVSSGILLDNIAIHPDYQGKGLGQKLLKFAESQAIDQGFKSLDLYTHECMTENIAIYKKRGYIEKERKEEYGYRRIYMRKLLY